MVNAIVGILQEKNDIVLPLAASVLSNLIISLPGLALHSVVSVLVHPCSSLLSFHQSEVTISCAIVLDILVSNMSSKMEKEIWDKLKLNSTVTHIISNILKFHYSTQTAEYFQAMASLLSKILCRWPTSRYSVWNDVALMAALEDIHVKHDLCVKVEVLKLYASIGMYYSNSFFFLL